MVAIGFSTFLGKMMTLANLEDFILTNYYIIKLFKELFEIFSKMTIFQQKNGFLNFQTDFQPESWIF